MNVGATSASVVGVCNGMQMLLIVVVVVVSQFGNSMLVGLCAGWLLVLSSGIQ